MVNRSQKFSNFNEIDNFFKNYNANSFVDWFNRYVSIPGNIMWNNERGQLIKIKRQNNWQKLWNNIPIIFGRDTINLLEFLALNSIVVNETGGEFLPSSEGIGSQGHPGISYLFDDLKRNKGDRLDKRSYNKDYSGNKDAYTLFRDETYKKAHGLEPLSFLKDTTDTRWAGNIFPQGSITGNIPNETDPKGITNTFLTSADFTKFRGRGFIQTTGRVNYLPIIKFVINYSGDDKTILKVKNEWKVWGTNLDAIATASTDSQWNNLFQNTELIIACFAISNLAKYIGFEYIDPNQSDYNLHKQIRTIGLRESGGGDYANKYLERFLIQLDILDKKQPESTTTSTLQNKPIVQIQEEGRVERTSQDPNSQVGDSNNIKGSLPNITNIFGPSIKPSAISFNMDGN